MEKTITLVTGTVGQDSHVVGIKLLSRALREAGFQTIELGGLTPPEEFIQTAQEAAADAIMVSSLYGMAEMDLDGFKDKCVEAGLGDVLLYLGGNLAVGRHDFKDDESKFRAMGFDRVYPPEVDFSRVIDDLKVDLQARGKI
jgi:methylaspartate mutase S subunit